MFFRVAVIVAIVGLSLADTASGHSGDDNVTEYTLYESLTPEVQPAGAALALARMQTEFLNILSSFVAGLGDQFKAEPESAQNHDPRLLKII
jgi:hypothetical protein